MKSKRGDTVIEVIFATTVFGLIAVISISLMNSGISTAQTAVELTLARNEIDAQAEALRFIQNGFAAERENAAKTWQFDDLWDNLTDNDGDGLDRVYDAASLPNFHTAQEETATNANYQNDGCAVAMDAIRMG
ncbi:MAG: type II secretion system GspH family protein, partial [Candidatus Nomurabacteria bacterium]|nr:type II secretion system GspH family protein [Candidatus Nomurabacteria bacterium]